ncbi:hypothetical protein Ancab_022441 [Ancistrocladus abbreviatus]
MGRAPCCEKMGLKKGPWTSEEDQILINHIRLYGHSNWRALPKQAGLLRCGKSCRLRWTNYLRPDIKRGNFTKEEEDTIIQLHEMLGNRWSAIAARLPGRTDNEIKNVWHTHLKKRLNQRQNSNTTATGGKRSARRNTTNKIEKAEISVQESKSESVTRTDNKLENSPQRCDSDLSLVTMDTSENSNTPVCKSEIIDDLEGFLDMDEDFWAGVLSPENSDDKMSDFLVAAASGSVVQGLTSPTKVAIEPLWELDSSMEFWVNILTKTEGSGELISNLE